ncbi:LPP20 family lipoprotein [bacterium]|nr:LPP20 family lipoprotein [bacterium]
MKRILCLLILVLIVYMSPTKADCSEQKETEILYPDWLLNPPEDPNNLRAVSTAKSKNLRTAIRIAYEDGRGYIAQCINTRVSTSSVSSPSGALLGDDSESIATETLLNCTPVEQVIQRENGLYRVFVLMEMPIDSDSGAKAIPRQIKVYGYGLPQVDANTEKSEKDSAYLAAIGDACREMLAFQNIFVSNRLSGSIRENKPVEFETTTTSQITAKVNGKIGNDVKISGEAESVSKEYLKEGYVSQYQRLFNDWIKFEYAGKLIMIRSGQLETPDIDSVDTEGLEKALEESGIKIEEVEYLDDGLCKVTLLQLTDEFLTTLDTEVPTPEASADKKYQPLLSAEVSFSEPSGNETLDANETGQLTVNIYNKGKGTATQVEVKLTPKPEIEGLSFPTSASIDSIEPNAEAIVEFPIAAAESVKTAQIHLTVSVTEGGMSIDTEPVSLTFMTNELKTVEIKSENEIDVPEWFLNPPEDPDYFYAVGSGNSSNLRIAIRKAYQQGRVEITRQMEAKVSMSKEGAESTSKVVGSEVLNWCTVVKLDVRKEGIFYRVYVLMEMPIRDAGADMLAKIKEKEHMYERFKSTQAYEEAEKKYEQFEKEQFKKEKEEVEKYTRLESEQSMFKAFDELKREFKELNKIIDNYEQFKYEQFKKEFNNEAVDKFEHLKYEQLIFKAFRELNGKFKELNEKVEKYKQLKNERMDNTSQ